MSGHPVPGSAGEHQLQQELQTFKRAAAFYDKQMLDHLNPLMREYLERQTMAFIATTDGDGGCDCSFRAGPPGFMRALDERTVIYPEFRGNGVMASMGNLQTNPHIGILLVDFFDSTVGLHINGGARVVDDAAVRAFEPLLTRLPGVGALRDPDASAKTTPDRWVVVDVEEAYIHCSKHIPLLARLDKDAAREERDIRGGDFFRAKAVPRPWNAKAAAAGGSPAPPRPRPRPWPRRPRRPPPTPRRPHRPIRPSGSRRPPPCRCWRACPTRRQYPQARSGCRCRRRCGTPARTRSTGPPSPARPTCWPSSPAAARSASLAERRRSRRPLSRVLLHDPPLHGRQRRGLTSLQRGGGLLEREARPGQRRADQRRDLAPADPGVAVTGHRLEG